MGRKKYEDRDLPYSYLIDNIKLLLIFLVVFNHLIAMALIRQSAVYKHVWYAITIFHMPAFVFVSGYLSKHPQNQMKNFRNLMMPYILGYTMSWFVYNWNGQHMDYELLRPSGTVMWYLLALFFYRLTIEALSKIRFVVLLSIVLAVWAGLRPEFSTYLSASRIVVFFPFFVSGYLWRSEYTRIIREFKGKWILIPVTGVLLYSVPNYMLKHNLPVDLFRQNHSYQMSGVTMWEGISLRILMYVVSFIVIFLLFAILPDRKHFLTFLGRNTMPIYFFHYPILIVANGLLLTQISYVDTIWGNLAVSAVLVLVLGSPPVDWLYTKLMWLIGLIIFKKEKSRTGNLRDDEYDEEE